MNTIIKTLYSGNKKQRVSIFQRPEGSFGFIEEYFSENEFELCWVPTNRNASIFDILETAEREIRSRVDWLIYEQDNPTQT